jgi:hypothetical protein
MGLEAASGWLSDTEMVEPGSTPAALAIGEVESTVNGPLGHVVVVEAAAAAWGVAPDAVGAPGESTRAPTTTTVATTSATATVAAPMSSHERLRRWEWAPRAMPEG